MEFSVIRSDGVCVMSTSSKSCIPTDDQLNSLAAAGYTFELNGKPATRKKVKDFLKEQTR